MIGSSNGPAIIEFLKARPFGVSSIDIAIHLGTSGESAAQSMDRLQARGLVARDHGNRMTGIWTLTEQRSTPPIFRAMETLQAMQTAARQV